MNVFHKTALLGLCRNRTRTLVTITGVVLSAAMFTGIVTFGTSLLQYLIHAEIAKGGEWHVLFSDADPAFLQELQEEEETAGTAAFENIGYALLEGAGEMSAEKPYLFLGGFSDKALKELPVHLTAGRMPENDREVLIPDHIAIKAGVRISVGDTLELAVGERRIEGQLLTQCDSYQTGETLEIKETRTYTVTGIYERPGFELHEAPGYTLLTRPGEEEKPGRYSVYVKLSAPRQAKDYAEGRHGESAWAVNENLLRFMGITDEPIFQAFFYSIGGILGVIIMTASVFLIYNSFHISLNERIQQFGILMSVGATSAQLKESVLFEGFCIGSMGIPFGLLAGVGCVKMLLPAVSDHFGNILSSGVPLKLSVSFPALLLAAAVSMVTILISAWIPARKAALTPVLECIRQTGEIRAEEKSLRTSKAVWKLFGLEGVLAMKNFKRNKKRYRSVILSLTFSMVLAITGSAFQTTLKRVAGEITAQAADGDVLFVAEDMSEETFVRLYKQMEGAEGIYKSTWQINPIYTAMTDELPENILEPYREKMGDSSEGPVQQIPLYVQFIEDDLFFDFLREKGLPREEYTGPDAKVLMCAVDAETHTVYGTGSFINFTLMSSSGEEEKEICAALVDNYPLDTTFMDVPDWIFVMTVPMQQKPYFDGIPTLDGKLQQGMIFWSSTPSKTITALQSLLTEQETEGSYMLYNLSKAFELFRNLSFVIDVFMYMFVFMLSLIAVANVFNTISTNIQLRRRELAMLRSVGMSERGFCRMMNLECVFYGMRTLLYGLLLSGILSFLIYKVLVSIEKMDDFAYVFPWRAAAFSVLGVFGIVFLTMFYATGKVRKENIIDALRDENV